MSNHNYPRRLLDDAIDRAVHELVQADTRPGFRRRVMTKVNAPTRRSLWAVRLLAPAGAIAAVVLLSLSLRPDRAPITATPAVQIAEQPSSPATPKVQAPVSPAPAGAPSERVESRESRTAARVTPSRPPQPLQFTFGPASDRVAATSVTDDAAAGNAPEPPDAIADFLPELPPVRISPIEIRPILIKPIELKPIGVGSSSTQP